MTKRRAPSPMPLHENETRKSAFGAYAEEYDAVRPRYPAGLFAAIAKHGYASRCSGTSRRRSRPPAAP